MSWNPHETGHARVLSRGGRWLVLGLETVLGRIERAVEAVAFWTAVGLPFVYLGLILGGGAGNQRVAIAGLLLVNAIALVVGHDHARDGSA